MRIKRLAKNPTPQWPRMAACQETIKWAHDSSDYYSTLFGKYSNFAKDDDEKDNRWLGEIGELGFDVWLSLYSRIFEPIPYTWIRGPEMLHSADFKIYGYSVDVKTGRREAPPHASYTGEVGKHHLKQRKLHDFYFLNQYQLQENDLWLMGAITGQKFLDIGVFRPYNVPFSNSNNPNDPLFSSRDREGMYQVLYKDLMPIREWLAWMKANPKVN